ncbi:MAG: hypothetical protein WBP72_11380 [Rhodocyclaceae bacterium]
MGVIALLACASAAAADGASASKTDIAYELTLSHYRTESLRADDIDLRGKRDNQSGWIALYHEKPAGFQQWRGGYERTDALGNAQVVTSLMAASRGFVAGAITADIGDPFFVTLGFGRTNLKPYASLNFDPNDAITYGAGWRGADDRSVNFFVVRDDRIVPGQRIAHLVFRTPLPGDQRLTLDIFDKRGPATGEGAIRGTGLAVTYDWPAFFIRAAHDPKVNFTQETMTRLSVGFRF